MPNRLTHASRSLISAYGRTITVTNPVETSYDSSTGAVTESGQATTETLKASVIDATLSKQTFEIQTGDLSVTIRADDFTPALNSEMTIGQKKYKAVRIVEVYCGEDLAMWEIQGRLM